MIRFMRGRKHHDDAVNVALRMILFRGQQGNLRAMALCNTGSPSQQKDKGPFFSARELKR